LGPGGGSSNNCRAPRILVVAWRPNAPEQLAVSSADDVRIDPAVVAAHYVRHADELRYFLLGVLRDAELAQEALQAAFAKAVELGHTVEELTFKGWLFRVAFHEALAIRRRAATRERATRKLAEAAASNDDPHRDLPENHVSRWETVAAVREALQQLPDEQQQVVRMRIYEQKRFAQIAEELQLPLGTVLSRMHLALKKLRVRLDGLRDASQ
jgi:RNA polymerase sigma factor (sigma-70 family)